MKLIKNSFLHNLYLNIFLIICLVLFTIRILAYPYPLIVYNVDSIVSSKVIKVYFLNKIYLYSIIVSLSYLVSKNIFRLLNFIVALLISSFTFYLFLYIDCEQCGNFGILPSISISVQLIIFIAYLLLSLIAFLRPQRNA